MISNKHGATIFGLSGAKLLPDEIRFFTEAKPVGFILFSRNIEDPRQLEQLTASIREMAGWNTMILVDQEGGRVARLQPPDWAEFPPALEQMQSVAPVDQSRAMWLRGRLIAEDLYKVGIDVNCTPLADILTKTTHPIAANRTYGKDAETVAAMANALDKGTRAGGVSSVVKHIPGYGRAVIDAHLEPGRISAPLEELERSDFASFKALNHISMGMTSHLIYEALDPDLPATLSTTCMRYIRESIRFDGMIMTDDVSMEALGGSLAQRSSDSIKAGCDVVLHCNGNMKEMEEIAEASGTLAGDALRRVKTALEDRPAHEAADIQALREEYEILLRG